MVMELYSKCGIVNAGIIDIMGDVYLAYSTSEPALEYHNGNPKVYFICIELEEGAIILGSLNFNDYEKDEKVDYPLYQDASHSFFNCSMFVAKNCENITITGKGVIDMQSVWDEENIRKIVHRGAKCIALKECDNIKIDGITVNKGGL